MNFGIRIRDARIAAGLRQSELGKLLGVANTTISNWEKDVTQPSLEMIELLCGTLDVSPNAIIGTKQNATAAHGGGTTLTPEQQKYLNKYFELNHEGRGRVHAAINYEHAKQRAEKKAVVEVAHAPDNVIYLPPPETVTVIRPSMSVCAGYGNYLDDNMEYEKLKVIKNKYTYGATHVINLSGDSMEPEFHDGDQLIITAAKGESPIYGRVGIFLVNGSAYLRQPLDGLLHAYNPAYDDIVPGEDDRVDYVGYVVGILDDSWIVG